MLLHLGKLGIGSTRRALGSAESDGWIVKLLEFDGMKGAISYWYKEGDLGEFLERAVVGDTVTKAIGNPIPETFLRTERATCGNH
jgi:hypothetical protein